MLKSRDSQGSFYDADYICQQLIPRDSFYRKFRKIVWPLIKDEDLESIDRLQSMVSAYLRVQCYEQ